MAIKFLSINKQYRRLFPGPIDPTSTWDDLEQLEAYLRSPTCFVNQILGCNGKVYIVAEKNNEKILVEIGTSSGGSGGGNGGNVDIPDNIMDILNNKSDKGHKHTTEDIEGLIDGDTIIIAGYHIGPEPPVNTSLLWIDTSEQGIDTSIDSILINEMKTIISNMSKEIDKLKAEIEDLKQNGVNPGPNPDPEPSESFNILFEDGDSIITEDGYSIVLEEFTTNPIELFNILFEDGDSIITEDGYSLILEEYQDLIEYNLLFEDGTNILSEDGYNIVLEEYIEILETNKIITEDDLDLLNENGLDKFLLEDI